MADDQACKRCFIHWFRNDLRLHDMPAVEAALEVCSTFYPVFIFDENHIGGKIGFNRIQFILDALKNINSRLQTFGGRLYVFCGNPQIILAELFKKWNITHLSYESDIQPYWKKIEDGIHNICEENNVEIIERVSHTLWNTEEIVKANGGCPPVTYSIFCHIAEILGPPYRPKADLNLVGVCLPNIDEPGSNIPSTPEELGVYMESEKQKNKVWIGGETPALQHMKERLKIEENAYNGYCIPNQLQPDLLGPPMSMSAALSVGCLSVRRFYWSLRDLYKEVSEDQIIPEGLLGQLLWREYFYAMCLNNPSYDSMFDNPICLNIPWSKNDEMLDFWTNGKTGFPFIDAAMRQLKEEGWIHHIARNAVACFLTRGDLWISWEEGMKVFMKYLLDADLPVCAGNWMWVSSSAFENVLQCPACISPVSYGKRFESSGMYIKKYVPELKDMPSKYVFEPWIAPLSVQESANCIIGKDYPYPIVDHQEACAQNAKKMAAIKENFLPKTFPKHCAPSNSAETRVFMWLPMNCIENLLYSDA